MREKEFYTPKEVATILGTKNSTVRKYAVLLEGYNYPIERDFAKNRIYTNANIRMFRELIELSEKFTLAKAAELLTADYRQPEGESTQESILLELEQVKERLHNQDMEIQTLNEKVLNLEDHFAALIGLLQVKDEDGQFIHEFQKCLDKI